MKKKTLSQPSTYILDQQEVIGRTMFNFFCLKESFLRQISEAGWNRVGVTNGNSALHSWKKEKINSDKNI